MDNHIRHIVPLIILAIFSLALDSCVSEEHVSPTVPNPTRVLLVYMGTDNNLSGYEQAKLQGLHRGWTGKSTDHIIAYIDDSSGNARLIEISNLAEGESPRRIASYGSENAASHTTLARVITDVMDLYPADSYGLLVFSHASGWLPEGNLTNLTPAARSIVIDGTSEMELTDFAAAIPDGVFDYMVFEACFMAGIEVAYELRHKADYILASSAEIVHPGFAPVYAASTEKLLSGNLTGFAQDAFNYTLTYTADNVLRSATYSVVRTAGLEALASFIKGNSDFTKAETVAPEDIQYFDRRSTDHLFFDFADYYGRLFNTDAQRMELERLTSESVVWKASTDEFMTQQPGYNGFVIEKYSGLTTYIPQSAFPQLNAAYSALAWNLSIRLL